MNDNVNQRARAYCYVKDTYPDVGECDLGIGELKKKAGNDGAWCQQLKAQDVEEEDGDGDGEGSQRTQAPAKKTMQWFLMAAEKARRAVEGGLEDNF